MKSPVHRVLLCTLVVISSACKLPPHAPPIGPAQRVAPRASAVSNANAVSDARNGEIRAPSAKAKPNTTVALVSHDVEEAAEVTSDNDSRLVVDDLFKLEVLVANNPELRRLQQVYQSARAKVDYIGALPPPTVGLNLFGHPIETAAGSQRANLTVAQLVPWLPRLDAQAQQACFEAAAAGQLCNLKRIQLLAEVRSGWFRLYALQKEIEVISTNQQLLKTIMDITSSRVATGSASQADVLAATLEFSTLEDELLRLRQLDISAKARLNQQVGRDAKAPIKSPTTISVSLPAWDQALLRDLAYAHQPEIELARIEHQASRWGVEVARLKHRPDFTLNASWFSIEDNRPSSRLVDVGRDAWALGAMVTLPVRHHKYAAMEQEALWKHASTRSNVQKLQQQYDATLAELWAAAQAAADRVDLYRNTILPPSRSHRGSRPRSVHSRRGRV